MPALKIKPLGNYVVIQRNEATKTKGGILLPETSKEKPKQGTVLAVGPGKMNEKGKIEATQLSVGDQVLFSSYSGTEYTKDGVDFLILTEDDILATVKG